MRSGTELSQFLRLFLPTLQSFIYSFLQLLVFIVVGVGLFFCIIFHLGVREHKEESSDREKILGESSALNTIEQSTFNKLKMSWKCWLKEHQFYQVSSFVSGFCFI